MRSTTSARSSFLPAVLCGLSLALASTGTAAQSGSLSGWPAELGTTVAAYSPPTAGDIDGDGDLEIIATVGDPLTSMAVTEGVYAYHHDGAEVLDGDQDPTTDGLFAPLDFSGSFLRGPVTLGNLDADPELEIVSIGGSSLHAWNGDGQPVPGWPISFPGQDVDVHNSLPVLVADVDADGANELIFTSKQAPGDPDEFRLEVYTSAGAPLGPGWPVSLDRWSFGAGVHAAIVGDIAEQAGKPGHLELVVGSHPTAIAQHVIQAFDSDGRTLWRYPIAAVDLVGADLDGDGKVEVIAVEAPRVERGEIITTVVVLDGSGTLLSRFRLDIGEHFDVYRSEFPDFLEHASHGYVGAHPINELHADVLFLGRVDGDETPEVVLSTRYLDQTSQSINGSDELYVHAHRGEIHAIDLLNERVLPGFPIRFDYNLPGGPTVTSPERLVDLDLDGTVELVAAEFPTNDRKELTFWGGDGALLRTERLTATTGGSLVIELVLRRGILGDLDRDGTLDYGCNLRRGELHLVRVPTLVPAPPVFPVQGWADYRHDAQRTGVWTR